MKKQLLISALALLVISTTASITMAENAFQKSLKGIGSQVSQDAKSIVKDVKTSVQNDVNNVASSSKNAKLAEINQLKNEKLKPINEQIDAKKKEISAVNKSSMLETEKTLRLSILTRQLKVLEAKRTSIENLYKGKLDALK